MKKNSLIYFIFILALFIGCTKEGPEGRRSLINFEPEPAGENCPSGGFKVELGLDLNYDNILDLTEIETVEFICNGNNSLIDIQTELPGENCASGGYKVLTGIDSNNNNILDDQEIQNIEYICNGNNSLVDISPESTGVNCTFGGFKIMSGIDINNNNTLDESEIQSIEYICNGNDGINSLFILEKVLPGDFCENGGYKIMSGLDTNWNHSLEESEIRSIDYICNGINTVYSVETEQPGENCEEGGFKVNFGMDLNGNGVLDIDEIEDSIYICNGLNGSGDGMIRLTIDWTGTTNSTEGIKGIGIYGFNKNDFPGVDSIVFAGSPYSLNGASNCMVELYDFKDNQAIENSSIISGSRYEDAVMKFSDNLYDEIPSGIRDIGIQIKTRDQGTVAGLKGNCYLYLYRKIRTNNE